MSLTIATRFSTKTTSPVHFQALSEFPSAAIPLPERGHFCSDRPDIFAEDGHRLAVMHVRNHLDLGLHTHDFVELVFILGGRATHLTQEVSYPLAAGDAFVITPGSAHGYAETRDLELCNVYFDPEGLALPVGELSCLPGYHGLFALEPSFRAKHRFQSRLFLPPAAMLQISEWAGMLEEQLRTRPDGYRFMSIGLLIRIIGFVSRTYTGISAPGSRPLLAVNRVISHIERHYNLPLPLAELARMAHMCERSLQRYFQGAFGLSPVDYINRLRIEKACRLIGEGEMNITQASESVGIPDSNYFARVFRRFTGTSPSAFRRSSRQEQRALLPLARGR